MFAFANAEKVIILSGCTGLLAIVAVITLCIVCPSCPINKRISKKNKREKEKLQCLRNSFPLSFLDKESPPPYQSPPNQQYNSNIEFNRRSVNSVSSVCSDADSITGIPLPLLSDTEIPAVEIKEHPTCDRGYVNITLQYKRITGQDKKIFPQLRVDLKEAGDLPYRVYGGRCNTYFIINLYDWKGLNKKRRKRCEHQFYSTVVKKCQHPVYNESFFFPMENINLKKCSLKVEAWDQDKLANDTILGEVKFNLRDITSCLLQEPSKEFDLTLKLEDSRANNGHLLLGLCYLPTAERMTIAVLKANSLKCPTNRSENSVFYVQGMAIHSGKIFERRKTSSRPSCESPVFNEMLMFDVPFSKLDQVVILLTIYSTIPQRLSEDQEDPQTSKDLCLGKVVIGSSSRKNSLTHWNSMRNSPRRQVIQWHELR